MAYKDDYAAIAGLDYWWELDGDETDSVGTANSDGGTDPSWVSSIVPNEATAQCGDYNGSTMETLIPNQSDINSGTTTQKSIHCWVVIDTIDTSGNGRVIWGEGGATNGLSIYVYNNGGTPTLYFDAYVGSTHDTLTWTGVSTGTLYFISAIIDFTNGNQYLYVNGTQVASTTGGLNIGTSMAAHSGGMAFGGVDSTLDDASGAALTGYFDGRIADMGYVAESTCTTLSEHQSIYQSGVGGVTITSCEDDVLEGGNETDNVIVGTGFEAAQGTGDVELVNNSVYGSGTIFVSQTIDSWADTTIQFDAVQGSLTIDTTVYLFVTNDSADRNAPGYPVYLGWPTPVITDCEDEQIDPGETNIDLIGSYFENSQGTGKVELVNNATYGSGTIFVEQDVNTWAKGLINFDSDQGTIPNGTAYLFVTTNGGKRNATGYAVNVGPVPQDTYQEVIEALTPQPQHLWPMQNNYTDVIDGGPAATPLNSNTGGTPSFSTTTPLLCRGDSHALLLDAANEFASPNDAVDDPRENDFNALWESHWKGLWIRCDRYHQAPSIIWEEGASANDMCFVIGFGNILLLNCLDSGGPDVQVFSDKPIKPNRNYFIAMKLEGTDLDNEVAMYIDGVRQGRDSGNPYGLLDMNAHNGDMALGWNQSTGTYGTLIVGGTVISFGTAVGTRYSHMWSRHDGEYTDANMADLFELGVGPDYEISSDTPANMQTDIETYDDTSHPDAALTFYVDAPSGATDLELVLTNQVFHDDTSIQIQWRGGGVLTLVNEGASNVVASKCSNPWGGSIVVVDSPTITFVVQDASTLADLQNARVLITAATGGDLPYQDSVTIVRSGSVATVTHTAHGLRTGQKVVIEGAVQPEYNGIRTITVTGANTYTYTVSGTPTTPATGTITATSVIVEGLTDVNGEVSAVHRYTSAQPIEGWARRATSSPLYRTGNFEGSISNADFEGKILLIGDE